MPLSRQTLKSIFSKKKSKRTDSVKDHEANHTDLGTEMTVTGLEVGQNQESLAAGKTHSSVQQQPQSCVSIMSDSTDGYVSQSFSSADGGSSATQTKRENAASDMSKTQPVRPPRARVLDPKTSHTALGLVNHDHNKLDSITSDYGTVSQASSMASDMSDMSDMEKVAGQLDRLTVSGPLKHDRVRDSPSNASLSSHILLDFTENHNLNASDGGSSSMCDPGTRDTNSEKEINARGTVNTNTSSTDSDTRAHIKPAFQVPMSSVVSFQTSCSGGACCPDLQSASNTEAMFPKSALDTPIGTLRKSRKRICLMLNIEQDPIESHLTPDYRGLAELLDFDSLEIQNLYAGNPTEDLLRQWARSPGKKPFLWNLICHLQTLGRQEVLEDCCGLILEDVADHIAEQNMLLYYTVGRLEKFDCYVNIADEDLMSIGREVIDTLEGVYGLHLCLTLRDVTLGGYEYEQMAEMLETRCRSKVVIVLSRHYGYSGACQFLTQFAVTLDPGARMNKLIPLLVDEDVEVPRVLRCLAMLNYHRDRKLGFLWPRLRAAIKS